MLNHKIVRVSVSVSISISRLGKVCHTSGCQPFHWGFQLQAVDRMSDGEGNVLNSALVAEHSTMDADETTTTTHCARHRIVWCIWQTNE